jgi:hypothetical protein
MEDKAEWEVGHNPPLTRAPEGPPTVYIDTYTVGVGDLSNEQALP